MDTSAADAPLSSPATDRVEYDPVREVRIAVVIYGGVSLAIYINGIVQELLALVRATASHGHPSREPLLGPGDLTDTTSESVYRKLGQLLVGPNADTSLAQRWDSLQSGRGLPIRTRFVLDVLSGTSAGGINAIFLAKALATNAPLKPLQLLWKQKGDIQLLINDKQSLTPALTRQRPPRSLLNSHRMYLELLQALDGMTGDQRERSPLVDQLDLFSTTTDIHGLELPITLADGLVHERRHRNVFHFQYRPWGTRPRNDFADDDNPFLAYAARCTSAFPFAFEPMALSDIFPILQVSEAHRGKPYCDPDTTHWQKYYTDYAGGSGVELGAPFQSRAFGDGGYLDNKPFTYATKALLQRHADLPVDRKLLYIEPSPEPLRAEAATGARPDALANSVAALLTLPRYETIRQDLEDVVDRNLQIERINRVVEQVDSLLQGPLSGAEPKAWQESRDNEWGAGYATYERLKLTTVTDDLANRLGAAFHIDVRSADGTAIRILASAWRQLEYPSLPDTRRFLLYFDTSYRLRRIRQVWRHIHRAHAEPPVDAAQHQEFRAMLRQIKDNLGEPYRVVQALEDELQLDPAVLAEPICTMAELRLILDPPVAVADWPGLDAYPHAMHRTAAGARERAEYVLQVRTYQPRGTQQTRTRRQRVTEVAEALNTVYGQVLIKASNDTKKAVADEQFMSAAAKEARRIARDAYERFDRYDSAVFPITFGTTVGECDRIDVHRLSPVDATARNEDTLQGRQKLRGQTLGAFGAFLDERWRTNDILWGRLDAAERIITILLPDRDPTTSAIRRTLVDDAHRAIVCEALDLRVSQRADWKHHLKEAVAATPLEPSPEVIASSAARATAVTGDLLDGIADAHSWRGRTALARVALFGRFLWQFIEVSVPRTWPELFGTYFAQLALFFAGVLVVAAVFDLTSWRFASLVFAVAVLLFAGRQLLRRYLRGDLVVSPATAMGITAAVVMALAIGIDRIPATAPGLAAAGDRQWQQFMRSLSGGGAATLLPTLAQARSLLLAASLVTIVAAIVMVRAAAARAEVRSGGVWIGWRLQWARTSHDIEAVVGRHDVQARMVAARATRADTGFAGAYGTLLFAAGLYVVVDGVASGWAISVLGLAGAAADAFENRAILQALREPVSSEPLPLSPAPWPFALAKWALLTAAVLVALVITLP